MILFFKQKTAYGMRISDRSSDVCSSDLFTPRVRGLTKAQRLIEQICLHPHQAQRLDADGTRYRLAIAAPDDAALEETIAMLLDEMHRIADNHQCFLAVALRDEAGGRHWD